ncbi:baculoviral IAP repeat-containing protein 7-A-like [Pseudomyrmex gracilis]|uniref:baculoviral IAP repeat-containing protein 7-A-like n=1 Tax=Pseudomyrmex gracilis TaxID=219809 RepID=UPI0009951F8A|nr:baculoviral IAP repeat-containing protein 7-A-like [Pseudomyrmex gracilis]
MNVEENRFKTLGNWPTDDAARFAKVGFYHTGNDWEIQCFFCGAKISDATSGDKLPVCHQLSCLPAADPTRKNNGSLAQTANKSVLKSTSPSSQPSDASTNNTEILQRPLNPHKEYRTFQQRLESFENWPVPSIIRPEHLALAGFYYLQYKDMVECAFCGGVLMNWKPNQDPNMSHRSCFPNCDFYKNEEQNESIINMEKHMTPVYPKYAAYQKRLQTFRHWPKHLNQTPEMLATAGFFYTGYKDQVRCFHCDGGIQLWNSTDDVWEEHALWFPDCGFVHLMRGSDFVKSCADKRKPNSNRTSSIELSVDETGIYIESPTTSRVTSPVVKETANFEQNAEMSISSSSTAVQDRNPVTDKTYAKNVTSNRVVSLTTLASEKFSKSTLNVIFEMLLKNIDLISSMAETEIRLYMALFTKVKTALKKLLILSGETNVFIDQLIEDAVCRVVDAKIKNEGPNLLASKYLGLLKQPCTIDTVEGSDIVNKDKNANEINMQKSSNAVEDKLKEKKDNKSDDMSSWEKNRMSVNNLCKVCFEHKLTVAFYPCQHILTCEYCGPDITTCPLCRNNITAYVRYYL